MVGISQRMGLVFSTAIAALLLGVITQAIYGWVLFGFVMLFLVIHNTRHLMALEKWLLTSDHSSSSIPPGSGAWDTIFAHLARYVRAQTKNRQLMDLELKQLQNGHRSTSGFH